MTSGGDPTKVLARIADHFGDDYYPVAFMTGDGHGHPPFKWATMGDWKTFFEKIVAENMVCLHVEEFPADVRSDSVPALFKSVYTAGKVYGWEPAFYQLIREVMELLQPLLASALSDEKLPSARLIQLLSRMIIVGKEGHLKEQANLAEKYQKVLFEMDSETIDPKYVDGLTDFLSGYNRASFQLRTDINDEIGAIIQSNMNRHPDDFHLITCGDAHILHNPLYKYVHPKTGAFGVVDPTKG